MILDPAPTTPLTTELLFSLDSLLGFLLLLSGLGELLGVSLIALSLFLA